MPQFAANLTMLFADRPFLERFEAARQAGFEAVEFLFPYEWPAQQIKQLLDHNQLQLVLHNLPAGDWAAGDRGMACDPARVSEFRQGVAQAIEYAKVLGVPQLNCLAGKRPAGVDPKQMEDTLVENLGYAATELKQHGLHLVIEAINSFDIPGFYLNTTAQTLDLIEKVGSDNLFVQYDIYHMQRMEGELANTLEQHLDQIAHIQLADNPGRNEPGTGEINYAFLFKHLDRIGYKGWIGCEYNPAGKTEDGLGWREALAK